jgi:mono/diheme cytochrome c family protein
MGTKIIACPSCDAKLRGPVTWSGKRIKCPKCNVPFHFPAEDALDGSSNGAHNRPQKPARRPANEKEVLASERVSSKPRKNIKADPRINHDPDARRPVRRIPRKTRNWTPLFLIGGAILLLGAGIALAMFFWPTAMKKPQVAAAPPPAASETVPDAAGGPPPTLTSGRKVFDANGCAKCHSLVAEEGSGNGPGRGRKFDLSRVGGKPDHTVEWITEYIRDPKAHKPNSRMPSFAAKIQPQNLRILAEFLAGLK